jgi:hypothetical protein
MKNLAKKPTLIALLGAMVLSVGFVLTSCVDQEKSQSKTISITDINFILTDIPQAYEKTSPQLIVSLVQDSFVADMLKPGGLDEVTYSTLVTRTGFSTSQVQDYTLAAPVGVPLAKDGNCNIQVSHGRFQDKLYKPNLTYWTDGGNYCVVVGAFVPNGLDFQLLGLAVSKGAFSFDGKSVDLKFSRDFTRMEPLKNTEGVSLKDLLSSK